MWKATCYFSKGIQHQKQNLDCQDYGDYLDLDKVIIGVVADGAGCAKYADVAAERSVVILLKILENFKKKYAKKPSLDSARNIFKQGIQKVKNNLVEQAKLDKCSPKEFACTIAAFVATPDWIIAMQIGDCFLVIRLENEDYKLIFKPDKGEFINETTFITSENALEDMQVQVVSGNQKFICASTDGLEEVAIRRNNLSPFNPFFKPLEVYLETTSNPQEEKKYLIDFMNSERLNSRTIDDKTLLLCLYE